MSDSETKFYVRLRFWNPLGLSPVRDYHWIPPKLRDRHMFSAWSLTINDKGKNSFNYDARTRFYIAIAFGCGMLVFHWYRNALNVR